jgi:cellulose synthase/poly-beta-1,6-N-acetylglucosamine synthase-like glycosyltransferase
MSDLFAAFFIWLPLGTVVPLLVARFTGSDWRGAVIEASLFATMGLVVFPILLALIIAIWTTDPNVHMIFAVSFGLAIVTNLVFRRQATKGRKHRH